MIELGVCSALQKVFSDAPLPPQNNVLRLFLNERGSLQLCLRSNAPAELSVICRCDLPFRTYLVREVYSDFPMYPHAKNCTLLKSGPAYFPDLLEPFGGTLRAEAGVTYALRVEFLPDAASPGAYEARFAVTGNGETAEIAATVLVGKTALAPQALVYTDWFHADCLATYYKTPVFSQTHWEIVERFMQNAAEHGVNCILTPLFTPPLDTAVGAERPTVQLVGVTKTGTGWEFDFTLLEKWMDMAERCGITHFEFSHLFTQWGALAAPKVIARTPEGDGRRVFGWETDSLSPEYHGFLRALGKALTAFTDARGVTARCMVHCSDEPGGEHIERYRACAALVHEAFAAYPHIDALSDYVYYEQGLVTLPVPSENSIGPFAGNVPQLWTYYCCGQVNDELPNRFFATPEVRNRILGTLLYKYDCAGFLHWGYNFYYSQLSKYEIDPFTETSAGAAFPSGDAFCVYPGEGGVPLPSLRQKTFYDGLQDLRALRAAEAKLGRDNVLEIIRDTLGDIDFTHYPMDETAFFAFRKALWEKMG